ncbi:MAG TPA: TetR/AcrR family transcriptional regulator [Iamia sp.]|nr:TetR/AcrR family transcriptional regulator [Iamia sp.]
MTDGGGNEPAPPDDVPADDAPAVDAPPVDGRTARAQRTRDAIVGACVALVDAGDYRPTAPRIAEEAGVSVRSVFQHFDDLETLFGMVAERALGNLAGLIKAIDPDLPFDERVQTFVVQRALLLEAVTPIRRAATVHAPFSPGIQARVVSGHEFFRAEVAAVFGHELDADPRDRDLVIAMLDVAASWTSWEQLRTLDGHDVDGAREVLAALLHAILGPR